MHVPRIQALLDNCFGTGKEIEIILTLLRKTLPENKKFNTVRIILYPIVQLHYFSAPQKRESSQKKIHAFAKRL
tara:strand:+ start:73 stop:294 length:222 start_codon:yes stop_codon:yes gene_type:complete